MWSTHPDLSFCCRVDYSRKEPAKEECSMGIKKSPMSDETKQKISLSKKGSPSPNKGKKFNNEYKKKLSLAKKGIKKNLSVVERMRESQKKIWLIENPSGDLLEFIGYNSFKDYVKINLLDVSITSLKSNGTSRGWKIVNKIKKQ